MTTTVRIASIDDASTLHRLAAATFGLACPPGTTQAAIDDFIGTTLSEASFSGYLLDDSRVVLIAETDGEPAGYTMLVFTEPSDPDVVAVISAHPTAELSKVYVLEGHHGAGVAGALMTESLNVASGRKVAGVWLGVNQHNARANRFYDKSGFATVGTKKFLVGGHWEDDFVREYVF
ncbi:MAG: diamine N-acetyltransferase [Microbacteriaceae bacterium]|jgi:ribosomal protein S18 acetylase RimI-like enzyme|nr:family N-acetyltransferase [Microbacteriaceae bacterium]MDQ1528167.1 diamine N-acetyltransferase [Microbacteriaceae bacterium]